MTTDLAKVKAIFLEAVEGHVPGTWGAYLDGACGQDQELRRHVEMLLDVHSNGGSLLEKGAIAAPPTIDQPRELPGTLIGPYKLLEQIGEGGMGLVYMAEQQRPVRRLVALKLIKPGMDSKQVIARFEAEKQALAMMDHREHRQGVRGGNDRHRPLLLRDGVGPRHSDQRVLRPETAHGPRAAGAVHSGLPGGAACPPKGNHPSRPEADQRPGHDARYAWPSPR